MTRNEALEKIREFFIDNKGHVKNWSGYNTNDVSDMILKFFEDELGMKQIKKIDVQTHQENVFSIHFVHGWDEEK